MYTHRRINECTCGWVYTYNHVGMVYRYTDSSKSTHPCVAYTCCNVLQCVPGCCKVLQGVYPSTNPININVPVMHTRVALCCGVALCCIVSCIHVCSIHLLQCVAVCCSVLQYVAVCCSLPTCGRYRLVDRVCCTYTCTHMHSTCKYTNTLKHIYC